MDSYIVWFFITVSSMFWGALYFGPRMRVRISEEERVKLKEWNIWDSVLGLILLAVFSVVICFIAWNIVGLAFK